jgi:hypothetical protein
LRQTKLPGYSALDWWKSPGIRGWN